MADTQTGTVTTKVPAAVLMILAGVAEIFLGVKAERQSLESIAQPLTAEDGTPGSQRAAARS